MPTTCTYLLTIRFFIGWRQLPETGHNSGYQAQPEINVVCISLLAQTKSNAGARLFWTKPHRDQDMRWFNCTRRTRRACRDRQPLQIESDHQSLAFDVIEAKIRRVRNPWNALAIHAYVSDLSQNSLLQP